jgi:hypothetical protein
MFATIRRYEGVDTSRTEEVTRKIGATLVPQLRELEGFRGYYALEAGNGVFSSFGLFESETQADEATKVAASWVTSEKLETALPNPPPDPPPRRARSPGPPGRIDGRLVGLGAKCRAEIARLLGPDVRISLFCGSSPKRGN